MIFHITVEIQRPGEKWVRHPVETSHWESARPILENQVRTNPGAKVRLVAEMVEFPVPDEKISIGETLSVTSGDSPD